MQLNKNNRKQCACFLLFLYIFSVLGLILIGLPIEAGLINTVDADNNYTAELINNGGNFNTVRDATECISYTQGATPYVCCYLSGGTYYINRGIVRWDTSGIPDDATIESLTWTITIYSKGSGNQKFYLVNGFNAGYTVSNSNYDRNNWTYEHAVCWVNSTGSIEYTVNQNLTNSINLTGYTTYYVLHSKDYDNTAPTDDQQLAQMGLRDSDLTITYSSTNETSNLSDYCAIGDLTQNICTNDYGTYKFLEAFYDIRLTEVIRGIDLPVTNEQYNYQNDANQYYININGVTYSGSASFSTEVFYCGSTQYTQYLLTFENINHVLDNQKIKIAFGFKTNGDWDNWQRIALSNVDMNNDNYRTFKLHSSTYYFADGIYNGNIQYGYEIPYRIWYDCFQQDIDDFVYDFESDTVFVSPASNGSLEYITGDPINYMVYSQDMTTQPYIHINKDESNLQTIPMNTPLETRVFTPLTAGSYNITLVRGGSWKAGINFTVYGQPVDNYIYTIPSKSYPFTNVKIYYNYTSGTGYDGRVIVSTSKIFSKTVYYELDYRTNGNESGFRTWQPSKEGLYYVYLAVVYPNNLSYEVCRILHPCYYNYPNELTGHTEVYLDSLEDYITWEYSHNFLLWDVVIRANNHVVAHVGNEALGTFTWTPSKTGIYNSTLEVLTNIGYICLDYHTFTVYGGTDYDQDMDNDVSAIMDNTFTDDQQFILGIGVILIGLFAPLYIIKRFNIKALPNMTYLFTGASGLGIAIWMGLLPLWIIVLFVFIFTSVIMWNVLGQMGILGGITDMSKATDDQAKEKTKQKFKIFDSEKARRK